MKEDEKGENQCRKYIRKRNEYNAQYDKKRTMKKEEEKIRSIRVEKKIQKYVNKYRKKRERINKNIEIESQSIDF